MSGSYTDISGTNGATYSHDGSYNYLRVTATYTDAALWSKTLSNTRQIELPSGIGSDCTLHLERSSSQGYNCSSNEADTCVHIARIRTPGDAIYYLKHVVSRKTGAADQYPSSRNPVSYSLSGTDADYFDIDLSRGGLLAGGPKHLDLTPGNRSRSMLGFSTKRGMRHAKEETNST